MKQLYIAEKPSVAQEFAKALHENFSRKDGYLESEGSVVTWCVGHLVTMSYPEVYDPALKQWKAETLPFLPKDWKYEVIGNVKKQFDTVKELLNRSDVDRIYVCTDSGREGEYIYRLVDRMAKVPDTKDKRRVWIDSQTEEEILRGIREAKPLSEYNNLSDAAYLRAKEDYLMGINFSRVLTIKYGATVQGYLNAQKRGAISVGRVMTCVLGMVVRREREIRSFVKTPFYRIVGTFGPDDAVIEGEWRAVEGTKYFESPLLYKENGFKKREDAERCIEEIRGFGDTALIDSLEKKTEKKNPPLLFNLAELQNECARRFKISPDQTLNIVQELYEKKLVTYPRTDARVLSTAVAKEITKNLGGLAKNPDYLQYVKDVQGFGLYEKIAKTKYTDDKKITDHYAIIPTGQGLEALPALSATAKGVYDRIVRRFLAIFYPPAEYKKIAMVLKTGTEKFFSNLKILSEPGYLALYGGQDTDDTPKKAKKAEGRETSEDGSQKEGEDAAPEEAKEEILDASMFEKINALKKGMELPVRSTEIKEGETKPPKRYNSGSLILAMENAGQLIEDEELRAQIKGSGIGTSATRAEILNKLVKIGYLNLNKKTQIVTPMRVGEMVYEIVGASIRSLLNAELTASWEKGLTGVAEGTISEKEYLDKLEGFVARQTNGVKERDYRQYLIGQFRTFEQYYK
ncbi:MAG: type IA DNA topoisomerase [Lachnospiraceae bacterium]|nr:type IA DNA topoisomerase [Lachnospiraceae bacterium]